METKRLNDSRKSYQFSLNSLQKQSNNWSNYTFCEALIKLNAKLNGQTVL